MADEKFPNGKEEAKWEADWLSFTEREYYNRVRAIMLESGMGEGDVEMILANVWESGWLAGYRRCEAHQP